MEKDILALDNFITVIKNNSNQFSANHMVNICKRKNNLKRDFLFVNTIQGKHIPVDPMKTFALYCNLVTQIFKSLNRFEKVVVIGFAETATAIGHYVSSFLDNCIYYMQTTREKIPNMASLLEFNEEHSHAMEQYLYGDISVLKNCDRIIFVDDEISTGNTVLNFITELKKLGIHANYGVASLLNLQDNEWASKFKSMDISTYYVLKGEIKNLGAKVPVPVSCEVNVTGKLKKVPSILEVKSDIANYCKERVGSQPYDFSEFSEVIYSTISSALHDNMPETNDNVLVLGTEEFMFAPMVFAEMLEMKKQIPVMFHATTRSPIETSDLEGYAIKKRYPITSCYDSSRNTFIYNLRKYDKVYIITDVKPNLNFIKDISSALVSVGCNTKNIFIITMKG